MNHPGQKSQPVQPGKEKTMHDTGKRDKGGKEQKKKPKLTQKEKRKLKKEKKQIK